MPTPIVSKLLPLVAFTLLAACAPSYQSSLTLELKGSAKAGSKVHELNRDGEWKLSECDACRPFVRYGGILANYNWLTPWFEGPGDTADQKVAVTFHLAQGIGVGPAQPQWPMEITINGRDITESTGSNPIRLTRGVIVDRFHYTGDPVAPWRIEYVIDGSAVEGDVNLTFKGRGTLAPHCEDYSSIGISPELCGGSGLDETYFDLFARTYTQAANALLPCPDEVLRLFVTPDQPMRGDAATKKLRSGSAEPLSCVQTNTRGYVCGGSKKVTSADGCSWDVDVVHGLISGQLYVNAKSSGCTREVPYCNELFY